jgi:hypothetical protein
MKFLVSDLFKIEAGASEEAGDMVILSQADFAGILVQQLLPVALLESFFSDVLGVDYPSLEDLKAALLAEARNIGLNASDQPVKTAGGVEVRKWDGLATMLAQGLSLKAV